jgi:hypothetical protein
MNIDRPTLAGLIFLSCMIVITLALTNMAGWWA